MPPSPRPSTQHISASPPEHPGNVPAASGGGAACHYAMTASATGGGAAGPSEPPVAHAPERLTALAASRAEAYKLEVEELRVSVAKQQRKQAQVAEEHAGQLAALQAELEARGRGEMLARTRCEAGEIELRECRQQLAKAREAARRALGTRQEEIGTQMLAKISTAMKGLATHGFRSAVLSWRRRALRSGVAQWAANAQLLEASEVEEEARRVIATANSFARAEAKASDAESPEAWLREVQRNARVARLANHFEALRREYLHSCLCAWRLASCAIAAEGDLQDVAGRLRAAQAGMVKVLDGRSATEEATLRAASLARVLVGAASLKGVRRERRERHHSLQLGFKPWLCLVMSDRLREAESVRHELRKSREAEAHTARRCDALTRELSACRSSLAATQKRLGDAKAEAASAAEQASRSDEVKQRSEALSRLARSQSEANEREKYALAARARTERQQVLTMRRGVVALALRTAVRRGTELCLARSLARWAAVAALMDGDELGLGLGGRTLLAADADDEYGGGGEEEGAGAGGGGGDYGRRGERSSAGSRPAAPPHHRRHSAGQALSPPHHDELSPATAARQAAEEATEIDAYYEEDPRAQMARMAMATFFDEDDGGGELRWAPLPTSGAVAAAPGGAAAGGGGGGGAPARESPRPAGGFGRPSLAPARAALSPRGPAAAGQRPGPHANYSPRAGPNHPHGRPGSPAKKTSRAPNGGGQLTPNYGFL